MRDQYIRRILLIFLSAIFILVGGVSCQLQNLNGAEKNVTGINATSTSLPEEPHKNLNQTPLALMEEQGYVDQHLISQWAIDASASSQFSDPEWAPQQMIGTPDTERCGDYQTAWASAASDTLETLVLTYTLSVRITTINIIESNNPNQVVQVILVGENGEKQLVYDQPPVHIDQPCPYTLTIDVKKPKFKSKTINIIIDQTVLGLGWNEIDAVEIVGERN